LRSRVLPQHVQDFGGATTTRSRGRCSRDRRNFGDGGFGGQFILGGARLQLLELERHLFDQQRRTFRFWAIYLALKFGDPQLLMSDQRQILGRLGACHCEFRSDLLRLAALEQERRLQRVDVVRQGGVIGIHDWDRIINSGRWLL
jgi:hypothetical protein